MLQQCNITNPILQKFCGHLKIYEERRYVHIEFMRKSSTEQWQWWLINWEYAHYWLLNKLSSSFEDWKFDTESKTFHAANIIHIDEIPVTVTLYSFEDDSHPPFPYERWSNTIKRKKVKYLAIFSI